MLKVKYTIRIIIVFCVLFTSDALSAQEVMTLHNCMQYALVNSAKLKLEQLNVDDAIVNRRDAIMKVFTPEISAGTYVYSNFGRSVDPETNTYVSTTSFNNGYSISGGITLFNGFAAVNNMKISKTALKMGIDRQTLAKDETCLAVMEAYYNVVYCMQLEKMLSLQVETAQSALERAVKQEKLGQKSYADVVQMQAEVADRNYQLISAKNRYASSLLSLKDLMLWPIDKQLHIDTSMVSENVIVQLSSNNNNQIIDNALASNPSISIARGEMENAKLELRSARWRFTPSVSLNGGWSTSYYTYPDKENYTAPAFGTQFKNNAGEYVQLSLSIPILGGLKSYSNLRKKKNASKRAAVEYQQKVRDIEAEVVRAINDRDGALAAFEQADKNLQLQHQVYNLNLKKLDQGLISAIDFQKVADNWINAKTSRLDALLKLYIKESVVKYYNGTSYIEQ